MALLWIEGYEGYGTSIGTNQNTYMGRRYLTHDYGSYWYLSSGRYGGYCGRGNGNYYAGTYPLTTCDTVVFGCASKRIPQITLSNTQWIMRLMDETTPGIGCKINYPTGEIDVYLNEALIGTTSGAGISNDWFYLEVKVKCHDTNGTVEVRINGVAKLSLSGINTQNGSNYYHDILRIYLSLYFYVDDVYLLDTTGSINNDFLGNQKVEGIRPEADSATIEWTPSTGTTHYNLVDETKDNDDTDYVESSTSGQIDLWDYPSLSGLDNVSGIQVDTTVKRTDASAFSLITPVKSGGTTSNNSGVAAGTSYDAKFRVLETDPDTAVAWTVGGVNAMQCGVKVE